MYCFCAETDTDEEFILQPRPDVNGLWIIWLMSKARDKNNIRISRKRTQRRIRARWLIGLGREKSNRLAHCYWPEHYSSREKVKKSNVTSCTWATRGKQKKKKRHASLKIHSVYRCININKQKGHSAEPGVVHFYFRSSCVMSVSVALVVISAFTCSLLIRFERRWFRPI